MKNLGKHGNVLYFIIPTVRGLTILEWHQHNPSFSPFKQPFWYVSTIFRQTKIPDSWLWHTPLVPPIIYPIVKSEAKPASLRSTSCRHGNGLWMIMKNGALTVSPTIVKFIQETFFCEPLPYLWGHEYWMILRFKRDWNTWTLYLKVRLH